MIFFYIFVLGGVVLVIGTHGILGTYMYRIIGLVMRCIGLVLGFVILYTLICLLGGYACGLGIFPHFVLG